jgi:hypothetical protein
MRGTSATTSPVAGLVTAKVAPESASTQAPSMYPWRRDEVALNAHEPSALLISAQVATLATLVIA